MKITQTILKEMIEEELKKTGMSNLAAVLAGAGILGGIFFANSVGVKRQETAYAMRAIKNYFPDDAKAIITVDDNFNITKIKDGKKTKFVYDVREDKIVPVEEPPAIKKNKTKQFVKNIVKEEVMKVIQLGLRQPIQAHGYMGGDHGMAVEEPMIQGDRPKDPDGYEGSMAKNNLRNAAMDATMLVDMIQDDENLEPWVEEKIAVAASMLNSVARYMRGGRTG